VSRACRVRTFRPVRPFRSAPGLGAGLLMAAVLLLVPFAALAAPQELDAQSARQQGSRLDQVEAHTNEGRIVEARSTLETWWDRERAGASREDLQRALWLRGILTLDPALAEYDFQRLVLEFPGGRYSDRALLRLAQSAHAADDLGSAAGFYRQLTRDYPGSPLRGDAEAWLERFGSDPAVARSAGGGAGVSRTPGARTAPGGRGQDAPVSERTLAIQLGAFQNEEGARRLIDEATAAGIDVRLVRTPGSALVRVRTGHFATRDALTPELERIRALGFDGFLVADASSERPL
jgi:hypothetical protein